MSPPPTDPDTQARPRRAPRQRAALLAMGTLAVVAIVAAVVGGWTAWRYSRLDRVDVGLSEVAEGDPRNFLIVGSDSRNGLRAGERGAGFGGGAGRRADTILVVRVDPRHRAVRMVSLPRDLWLPIAGGDGRQRINSAYADSEQQLIDTITRSLGIPIHHYVEVDFDGFRQLVSAVDGVPIYFDGAVRDPMSGLDVLHPGCVTLDADQALSFARSRHLQWISRGEWNDDTTGDLGRVTRQQVFVRRALDRASDRSSNPVVLKKLIDTGVDNVTLDGSLGVSDLVDLARRFERFSGDDIETDTLPIRPFRTSGGASVVALDAVAATPVLARYGADRGAGAAGDVRPALVVLNGSGVGGQAAEVALALGGAGYRIAAAENNDEGAVDRSEVRFAPADRVAAAALSKRFAPGPELVEDPEAPSGRVTVVLGGDFERVARSANPAGAAAAADAPGRPVGPVTTAQVGHVSDNPPPGVDCG